jgi:hypothetical protein
MKLIRSISAIALAFLVLFSSSSFIVGIHWCGGHVQDFALFTKAEVCPMEKNFPPCHKPIKNNCCEDQTVAHEGSGFKASVSTISFEMPLIAEANVASVIISQIIPDSPSSVVHYADYDPPTPTIDVTVDLQVFLI